MVEFGVDKKRAHRVVTAWTSEDRAEELQERVVDAGVDPDKLRIQERRIEVDPGP